VVERSSQLTLRALLDLIPDWSAAQMLATRVKLRVDERALSHLFIRAEWLAYFGQRRGDVRWPAWMGAARYPDVTKTPHIIIGPARIDPAPGAPPTIRWDTNSGGMMAVCRANATLVKESRFQRRFERDLSRVGWTPHGGALCFAAVLGTAQTFDGAIRVLPARSYEDVYVFPMGHLDLTTLDALIEVLDQRFAEHLANCAKTRQT
jgi:hypothetical protein